MNNQPVIKSHSQPPIIVKLPMVFAVAMLGIVLMGSDAFAYLDPGVGSFALQVIAASLVAVAFFARKFWLKIIWFFTRRNSHKPGGK
jgi:hypothetical protein